MGKKVAIVQSSYVPGKGYFDVIHAVDELAFFDYSGYPEYPQLFPPFTHEVSVLDLLFNEGPRASSRMLTFGRP